jgi:NAD(P)-dependent dehydrogenase (short-subunit alcohol dehydrogenase family)
MPEKRLAGLNALVTGSDRGIGKDMAIALGKEGANVSVHDLHSKDGAFETVDAVLHEGVQAMAIQADLSRGRDIASFVEHSIEQ